MEYLYCSCMFFSLNFLFSLFIREKAKAPVLWLTFPMNKIFKNDRFFRWLWFSFYRYILQLYKLLHIWSMEMVFVMQTSLNNVSWTPKHSNNLADAKNHLTVQSICFLVFRFSPTVEISLRSSNILLIWNCCTVEFLSWIGHLQEKYIYLFDWKCRIETTTPNLMIDPAVSVAMFGYCCF